jgi:hypothetical protein
VGQANRPRDPLLSLPTRGVLGRQWNRLTCRVGQHTTSQLGPRLPDMVTAFLTGGMAPPRGALQREGSVVAAAGCSNGSVVASRLDERLSTTVRESPQALHRRMTVGWSADARLTLCQLTPVAGNVGVRQRANNIILDDTLRSANPADRPSGLDPHPVLEWSTWVVPKRTRHELLSTLRSARGAGARRIHERTLPSTSRRRQALRVSSITHISAAQASASSHTSAPTGAVPKSQFPAGV